MSENLKDTEEDSDREKNRNRNADISTATEKKTETNTYPLESLYNNIQYSGLFSTLCTVFCYIWFSIIQIS